MKKKLLSIITISILLITSLIGCNNKADLEAEARIAAMEQKVALDYIYDDLNDMSEKSLYIASKIVDYWDASGSNSSFQGLFDKDEGIYYGGYTEIQNNVHEYRSIVKEYQTSIQDALKSIEVLEEHTDYHSALSNMYIEVNAFSEIACIYPAGYNLLEYKEVISNHKTNFEKAKSAADLLK